MLDSKCTLTYHLVRLVSQGEDFKTCVPGRRCRKAGELLSFSQPSSSSQFPPSMVANVSKTMLCQTCQIQHCTWPWGRLQQQWPDLPNQRPYLRSLQIGNVFKIHLKWKRWRRSQSGRAAGRKLETKGLLRKICFSPPTTPTWAVPQCQLPLQVTNIETLDFHVQWWLCLGRTYILAKGMCIV